MMSSTVVTAASKGDVDLLVRALKKDFGEVADEEVNMGLIRASANGNTECMSLLLDHGADIDVEIDDDTPLTRAINSSQRKGAKLLLDRGCDVNYQSGDYERTALQLASFNKLPDILKNLLVRGAEVNITDCYGDSALMLASITGCIQCIHLLLEAGADINQKSNEGDTPLHYAAKYGLTMCVKLLIKQGADLTINNMWSYTPLLYAVLRCQTEAAIVLIMAGSDVNAMDRSKRTVLFHAAKFNVTEIVVALLLRAARPDLCDTAGNSPLMEAIYNDNVQVVNMFLQMRCDVDITGKYRIGGECGEFSPLDIALRQNKNVIMASLLVHAGHSLEPLRQMMNKGLIPNDLLTNPIFLEWSNEIVSTPPKLLDISSNYVRRRLGYGLALKALRLCVPKTLKEYLALHRLPFVWDWTRR